MNAIEARRLADHVVNEQPTPKDQVMADIQAAAGQGLSYCTTGEIDSPMASKLKTYLKEHGYDVHKIKVPIDPREGDGKLKARLCIKW